MTASRKYRGFDIMEPSREILRLSMKERWRAIAKSLLTVAGTIIGAGIFALPALFQRVGFWPATLLFWILSLLVLATHFLQIEIFSHAKERARLVGHAGRWLGPIGFRIAAVTYPLQIAGVNFIYIILGGEFLASLARIAGYPGSVLSWQILFWMGSAAVVLFGLKFVADVEAVGTWLLVAAMVAVTMVAGDMVHWVRLPEARWNMFFLPFGVFLFAVSGMSVIGEAYDLVGRRRKDAYIAVTVGSLGAAFLSWLFGATLALAAPGGLGRSPADLIAVFPRAWAFLIPTVGFLAVATSYITTAQDLKATLHLDFRLPKRFAWFLALFVPMALLFLTSRDFLKTLDVVGTAFTGANGVLIALTALMVWKRFRRPSWMAWAAPTVAAAFFLGMAIKLFLR